MSELATIPTVAPCAANNNAIALPMPELPPVTNAVLPISFMTFSMS
jgi:hypothetical protein